MPNVLRLGPKEQGFVTFFLNRNEEKFVERDKNNMVYGKAIGTINAIKKLE